MQVQCESDLFLDTCPEKRDICHGREVDAGCTRRTVRVPFASGKTGFTLRTPYVRNRNAQTNLRRYARRGVYTPRVDLGAYTQTSTQYRLRTISGRWIYFICGV